jgi:hypothetical protein
MTLEWRDLWTLYCPELSRAELDECAWLQHVSASWPHEDSTPVEVCDWLAQLQKNIASD